MKKFFPIFAFLLFFSAAGVAQTNGRITGTVVFGGDKSVIHGASVVIAELKRNVNSDDAGNFAFSDIPPGRYTIHAHLEGFGEESQRVLVTAGNTATVTLELNLAGVKEQVTITASGSEQLTFEAIESVSTVDSTQITSRASAGLGDVLENEAGVTKRSSGPGTSRPVIRGFDGDRVKVATDGVSVGSLGSQSGDHAEPVDIFGAQRIEVVKGPATLLYGSNAIGGVVNSISGHDEGAHPGLHGYFTTVGATNSNQAAASVGVEYGIRQWMLWSNASGQRTGDYTAGGNFGKVLNSFTRNAAGSLGGGYFGSKAFFTTNFNYYQSRYGIPLDFREEDPELRSIRLWRNDLKFTFGYNDPHLFVSDIKFTIDISNYRHQEMASSEVGTTFRNNIGSLRGIFEQKKAGKLSGRFGFETYHRYFSTVGNEMLIEGPVRHDNFSVFALEELKWERVALQFGGRIENNRYNPANPGLIDRGFTGFSGAVGSRFDLWKGGAFVVNYSHGFRAPALDELYNNGPHDGSLLFEVGDPHLRPEVSDGIDLSLRQQNKRIRAEANFYYYHFKDFVFLAPTDEIDEDSGFFIADYLQADSRFLGTELNLDVTANNYLNVLFGLDYVNAELTDGTPLPRIAPLRGRVGLDMHYRNFSVKPEFVAVGRQDRVFLHETPTAGYGTFNIGGNYVISRKHYANIFSVNAFNLNNKLYFNHISFIKDISPEIGRGVRASYTIRFF
ncbi:MAG: TonB-dependent receptor [Pyrinomonadaceae bacterium]